MVYTGETLTNINAAQCRGARAMLQLGVRELAERTGLSPTTISSFERGRTFQPEPQTLEALRRAFEGLGIMFVNDDMPGVRLKKKA